MLSQSGPSLLIESIPEGCFHASSFPVPTNPSVIPFLYQGLCDRKEGSRAGHGREKGDWNVVDLMP